MELVTTRLESVEGTSNSLTSNSNSNSLISNSSQLQSATRDRHNTSNSTVATAMRSDTSIVPAACSSSRRSLPIRGSRSFGHSSTSRDQRAN